MPMAFETETRRLPHRANITCELLNARAALTAGEFLDLLTEVRHYCECEWMAITEDASRSYEAAPESYELVG
jgi:hypothetical protein